MDKNIVQKLVDRILAETFTQEEALSRLRTLKERILLELFSNGKQDGADAQTSLPSQTATGSASVNWLSALDKEFFQNFTRNNVYKLFDEMEKEIKKLIPLTIFLPFEPDEAQITELGWYLRKAYGNRFLMEIKFDANLLAGPALIWKGVYRDYSLKQKIADNRQLILKTLKEYVKH